MLYFQNFQVTIVYYTCYNILYFLIYRLYQVLTIIFFSSDPEIKRRTTLEQLTKRELITEIQRLLEKELPLRATPEEMVELGYLREEDFPC